MKKLLITTIFILSILFSAACKKSDFNEIKNYHYKNIKYLSPLSSSEISYLNTILVDYTFTITKKNFTITNKDEVIAHVESPTYIKKEYFEYGHSGEKEIKMDTLSELDVSEMEYGTPINKIKYSILDNKNKEQEFRFYWENDKVFIEKFTNNNNNVWAVNTSIIHYTLELGE